MFFLELRASVDNAVGNEIVDAEDRVGFALAFAQAVDRLFT